VPGFPKAKLNDIDSVAALIGPQTVAVLLEPIQGEAGVIEATPAFLRDLRRLCSDLGLLLMFDEVQTGIGRTGQLWGWQASGVQPDVMTLGKGLGGGAPIGALLAREAVCCFVPGDQGGTYHGNPLMCAAGLAIVDAVTASGFLEHTRARGEQLRAGLQQLADELGSAPVRGRGLLLALDLPQPEQATQLAETLRRQARGSSTGAAGQRRAAAAAALRAGAEHRRRRGGPGAAHAARGAGAVARQAAPPRARRQAAWRSGRMASSRCCTAATTSGGRAVRAPAVEGRRRRVFDAQLHRLRVRFTADLGHQRQRHVDAGGDTAAGEDVAVAHHAAGVGRDTPSKAASRSRQAQWQAARRPRSRPAAASASEPVHTDVT
jgi:hypothetical protein